MLLPVVPISHMDTKWKPAVILVIQLPAKVLERAAEDDQDLDPCIPCGVPKRSSWVIAAD